MSNTEFMNDAYKALQATAERQTEFISARRISTEMPLPWSPKPSPPTVSFKDGKVVIGDVEIEMKGCHIDGAECINGKWHITVKADG